MASINDPLEEDAGDSSHSLLSRRASEMGSRYVLESGVYMSSFAATIFIAALVTIGVSMLTLLVALTVMLNSCQSRSTGIIERSMTNDEYNYCKVFALHAELNNLEENEFPAICKHHSLQYYLQELNITVNLAESYFSTLRASDDQMDVILMDIDDIFLPHIGMNSAQDRRKQVEHEHLASMLVLRLFLKLRASDWPLILFTRKHSRYRNATVESLVSAGYVGWSSLIMRSDDELSMESWVYISSRRVQLSEQRFRITSVISSRMDAFQGSFLGRRNFKLAIPNYLQFAILSQKIDTEPMTSHFGEEKVLSHKLCSFGICPSFFLLQCICTCHINS